MRYRRTYVLNNNYIAWPIVHFRTTRKYRYNVKISVPLNSVGSCVLPSLYISISNELNVVSQMLSYSLTINSMIIDIILLEFRKSNLNWNNICIQESFNTTISHQLFEKVIVYLLKKQFYGMTNSINKH